MRAATAFALMAVFVVIPMALVQIDALRGAMSGLDAGLSAFFERSTLMYLFVGGALAVGTLIAVLLKGRMWP